MSQVNIATWAEFFESIPEIEADRASEDFMRERPMNSTPGATGVFDQQAKHDSC